MPGPNAKYVGSTSCRSCHENFYQLWSTSHHGKAMQKFDSSFIKKVLVKHDKPLEIEGNMYQVEYNDTEGFVVEKKPSGETIKYPMLHILGGKNICYFLTKLERGRLQVLPLSFDVNKNIWFDTAKSALRHFTEGDEDEALPWRHRAYTFNTSCYSCHISQLQTNFSLDRDTYETTWKEDGINCETCHGPCSEHIESMKSIKYEGEVKKEDLKLIVTSDFNYEENNSMCAPCHAKMSQISNTYLPGDPYFDHYDLRTLEDRDFYPDGRDLGENYTMTLWHMNPCYKKGKLDCIHCHTSSGRYRFSDPKVADNACLPCHEKIVADSPAHTFHKDGTKGDQCVQCHMPYSFFGNMGRSDHSFLSPSPKAHEKFGSSNACLMCHKEKDNSWTAKALTKWYGPETDKRQDEVVRKAELVSLARKGDWSKLDEMLAEITRADRDEVYANSLIRLCATQSSPKVYAAFRKVITDKSPLVRASAAAGLYYEPSPASQKVLLKAIEDPIRLVRIRAAYALSPYSVESFDKEVQSKVLKAFDEYITALMTRPDDPYGHYNLGNFHVAQGDQKKGLHAYQTAVKLDPENVMSLVNMALLQSRFGDNLGSEKSLKQALKVEPKNSVAHLNLGMLQAELKKMKEAEYHFRQAWKHDESNAQAAYNLGVMLARDNLSESITWCSRASKLRPDMPHYAYSLAYYLYQAGSHQAAQAELMTLIKRHPDYQAAYGLLASLRQNK
ncbi:MAG: ammonia-forming cytochrome c nitrite reductase subunit c552 [Planctomycetes bacterium]|nr:ammonia-forming cytochrome c nitrite reductase subunit c552 [Planctomycetota bacterium]